MVRSPLYHEKISSRFVDDSWFGLLLFDYLCLSVFFFSFCDCLFLQRDSFYALLAIIRSAFFFSLSVTKIIPSFDGNFLMNIYIYVRVIYLVHFYHIFLVFVRLYKAILSYNK